MKKWLFNSTLILLLLFVVSCGNKGSGNTVIDENIKIPLSDVSETVKFYTYEDRGVDVNYFAVLGSDGQPRVAFDACDVCGGFKGYRQAGTDIKCNNCGRVFAIDGLGSQNKGYGCWPSYLPSRVEGDKIVIKTEDLKNGRDRFV